MDLAGAAVALLPLSAPRRFGDTLPKQHLMPLSEPRRGAPNRLGALSEGQVAPQKFALTNAKACCGTARSIHSPSPRRDLVDGRGSRSFASRPRGQGERI